MVSFCESWATAALGLATAALETMGLAMLRLSMAVPVLILVSAGGAAVEVSASSACTVSVDEAFTMSVRAVSACPSVSVDVDFNSATDAVVGGVVVDLSVANTMLLNGERVGTDDEWSYSRNRTSRIQLFIMHQKCG